MKKRISGRKTFSLQPSAFSLSGFTLIEILVALVVAAITISVALESQITSLKIEQKARALRLFRFETQRIFSATHRVKNEEELTRLLETNNLCRIKSEKVQIESGTNELSFIKHELSAADLPSFSSVFFTGMPDCPGQKPAAGGIPVDGQK
jgi:prepilin-type N-terminal cleavage/methylation domain-containing protein